MPSWGILKSSKKKNRSARKVHFNLDENQVVDSCDESLSSSTGSDDTAHHQHHALNDSSRLGRRLQNLDISHEDIEDEEERECLRHLDQLGLSLENTFKEVETIDAYVKKLRYDFDHEMVPEKRYMSCICSAKLARTACCKKQIEVWQKLQHDIQEMCCHHHNHIHETASQQSDHSDGESQDQISDSECSSISTSGSHDACDTEFLLTQLDKMVLFDRVRKRLDPSADTKTFVEHWILSSEHIYSENNNQSGEFHTTGS